MSMTYVSVALAFRGIRRMSNALRSFFKPMPFFPTYEGFDLNLLSVLKSSFFFYIFDGAPSSPWYTVKTTAGGEVDLHLEQYHE